MRVFAALVPALLLTASLLAAQTSATGTLDIYFIDTEGGQATLFVSPSGESVLVDTGNPGERDLERILATLGHAGVRQIDHLLVTHYHGDHSGGVAELARRIPIRHFVDHGPTVETSPQAAALHQAYTAALGSARRTVVAPGDRLPVAGLQWEIVTAAGRVIQQPLAGAGQPNPGCRGIDRLEDRVDENAQSVGSVVTFGEFRVVDLGDLLVNQELDLMCPNNRIGTVDLYITSHHGLGNSGSAALVHAVRPRVAVMNNGTRKGGAVQAFRVLHTSPGLDDLWQLHWSHHAGIHHNAPGIYIANLDEAATVAEVLSAPSLSAVRAVPHDGPAHAIKVSARADGSFTVTNGRNGFSKTYPAR